MLLTAAAGAAKHAWPQPSTTDREFHTGNRLATVSHDRVTSIPKDDVPESTRRVRVTRSNLPHRMVLLEEPVTPESISPG
jgi:hypothetical protein